jgi:hypothetical protein
LLLKLEGAKQAEEIQARYRCWSLAGYGCCCVCDAAVQDGPFIYNQVVGLVVAFGLWSWIILCAHLKEACASYYLVIHGQAGLVACRMSTFSRHYGFISAWSMVCGTG